MRKVVALVPITRERSKSTGFFKAHIRPLGLTAEGLTAKEAETNLLRMFHLQITTYRRSFGEEMLTQMLTVQGVEWYWEDEYKGRKRVLDTAPEACADSAARSKRRTAKQLDSLPLAA